MRKYFALVKLLFTQQFKSRPSGADKAGKAKSAGTIVAFVVLGLALLPTIVSVATAMYYLGQIANGNVNVVTFLILVCQGLVLMFGMQAVISNVFVMKDADKLLYMPVRSSTIFLAKLSVAYINEVITTAVAILVLLLPFGLGAQASFAYYLMLLIALVLIPVLPLFVGCVVAMPVSALIARLSKHGVLRTILRVILYLGVLGLYMFVMYQLGFFAGVDGVNIWDNPELFINNVLTEFVAKLEELMSYFHPDYMLASAMLSDSFVSWAAGFFATLGENVALIAIVTLISLPFYRWIISVSLEGVTKRNKARKEQFVIKNRGAVKELMLTDLRRVARDGQIGFQSFSGIVMLPLIVVVFYIMLGQSQQGGTSFLETISVSSLFQAIAPLAILAYMTLLGVATNVLGQYPISRENKATYMLKNIPVPFSKILLAKVLLATAVMLICDFLTCLMIVLLLGVKWYFGVAMLITMALIGFGAMCVTTLLDLKNPKFGWTNFNQGLKNSKNSWLAMLIGLLASAALALISVGFVVWYSASQAWYALLIMWLAIVAVAAAFAAVAYKVMTSKAQQYFDRIDA